MYFAQCVAAIAKQMTLVSALPIDYFLAYGTVVPNPHVMCTPWMRNYGIRKLKLTVANELTVNSAALSPKIFCSWLELWGCNQRNVGAINATQNPRHSVHTEEATFDG